MSKKVDVKCPVCKEWYEAIPEAVGMETVCGNCRQKVVMVPRSSQAIALRRFVMVLMVLGGLALIALLYNWRLGELTRTLSGPQL